MTRPDARTELSIPSAEAPLHRECLRVLQLVLNAFRAQEETTLQKLALTDAQRLVNTIKRGDK